MWSRIGTLFVLASAARGAFIPATSQGTYCKPLDGIGQHILASARSTATVASDSTYRMRDWKIPLMSLGDVTFVTDEAVCEQAALAYDREMSPETSTLSRGVYVVRLSTWYLVVDGEERAGEWMRGIVLDSAYAKHSEAILL